LFSIIILQHRMSSPIRVGLIGLGKGTADNAPGLWGSRAHLPFLLASPAYTVTAICNSSTASAQSAIDFHALGPKIKAYGSPVDLAADPDVDLVVVSVKVGMHYQLAKPALEAGKDVFVEWPLGASLAESEELTKLADKKGVKTIVGLQARASPLVVRLKELVGEEGQGKIGEVVSSTVVGSFGDLAIWGRQIWPAAAEYYLDMSSGGNTFYIFFGHCGSAHSLCLSKSCSFLLV
jgi:predicted dehydrogenase